jgi:arylformamidase
MTTPFDTPDWRGMSQGDRDLGLNNGVHVPASAELVAGWDRRSAEMRAKYPDHLDLRYGPRQRNRIDFFKAAEKAPTLLFIHGGYWQTRAKESFALFAAGPMAHGINVALTGYTLAPDATLDEIVAETHAAIDFLAEQLPALGGDGKGIVVSGWSAGGHLTSMALSHPQVRAGMAISGIYDLEPIRHSYLNVKLALDEAASRRNSPMAHGINVALFGYTLAPDATLDQIVAEILEGIDFLAEQLPDLGGDPSRIIVSGWSAGGHLTSMALSHPNVTAGMAISGIYDLEPIRHSYLNVKLALDEAMSRRNSPVMQAGGAMKPLSLVVGNAELPLLRKQTADFAGHRAGYGLPVAYEEIPGADHFTILNEMVSPTGRITTLIRQLFE